jgi:hypothetical protein
MPLDTEFDTKTGVLWIILEGEIDFRNVTSTMKGL